MKRSRRYEYAQMLHRQLVVPVVLVVVVSILLVSCSKEEEPLPEVIRPVKTFTVKAGGNVSSLQLPGKVRATKRVNLAFQLVGGRLIQLPIAGREGQKVRKGELLARIDPKDFQVNLQNAQGRLKEAEASLKLAKAEYERVLRIREKDPGAVSGASVDRRREAVAQSQGRLESLQAAVDDAENKLKYTYLRAPFNGVIAKRFVDNFQEVKPKEPIASIQDITSVELLVDVPENVMAAVRSRGTNTAVATAVFPTAPDKQFDLSLKEAASDADPATQTYQVVLVMPQPEGINVLPGMTATVTASTSEEKVQQGSILIPSIAVIANPEGKNFVWIVDSKDMTVHKKDVKVGTLTGSENIDILEGLQGGEKIIVAGMLKLQEGMRVRLWDKQ